MDVLPDKRPQGLLNLTIQEDVPNLLIGPRFFEGSHVHKVEGEDEHRYMSEDRSALEAHGNLIPWPEDASLTIDCNRITICEGLLPLQIDL